MKFTIDRQKWLRGEGYSRSRLLRMFDKKMCCVGQMCHQLGVSDRELLDRPTLLALDGGTRSQARTLFNAGINDEAPWVRTAYKINDDKELSDPEREKQLKDLLAKHGHEVEFVTEGAKCQ